MLEAWPPHNLVQEFEFARLESCRSYSFRLERQVYGALLPDSPPDQRPLWPSSVNWPSGSFRSTAVVRMTAPKGW